MLNSLAFPLELMDSAATASSPVFDPPALSARAIEGWLSDAGCQAECAVETVDETASTNADLMARAREAGFTLPVLRAADFQGSGR